jgi:PEP-CTERM motif
MRALLILFFAGSAVAHAEPFTTGMWSTVPAATNRGATFFDFRSWDGETAGVAWNSAGLEFLHAPGDPRRAVPFRWESLPPLTDLGGTSKYLRSHVLQFDGEFSLDNGHGFTAGAGNTLLLRLIRPELTRYWVWFEDVPLRHSDRDYNDHGWSFIERRSVPRPPVIAPVPEPATVTLIALGLGVLAGYRRRNSVPR